MPRDVPSARSAYIQNNFTSGEVSPRLYMRTDQPRYKNGLAKLENMTIMPHGGATSRTGTVFVAEAKDSSKRIRLEDFQFSIQQAYIVEFGHLYLRFYRNNGQIRLTSQAITAITKANPAVVTYTGADTFANGDSVAISGVAGMTQVNNRQFTVANVNTGANTFELSGVNSSSYDTYTSGGIIEEIYEIVTPYTEDDLPDLSFVQSADILYIVHPDFAPRELTRTSHTSWTLARTVFEDGPYGDEAKTGTLTASAVSGSITLTASVATFAATDCIAGGGDFNRLVRIQEGANWRWLEITAFASATSVTATVKGTAFSSIASPFSTWKLGAWSTTTGFPFTVTFYENRWVAGGNTTQPDTIWGSRVDDYPDFTEGTADDDPFTYTLSSEKVNEIRWLSPQKTLRIGTSGGEFSLSGASTDTAVTPTSVRVTRETAFGSAYVKALLIESATLFWQRAGLKMREFVYSFEVDNFVAPELTLISEHISYPGIEETAYQAEPDGVIWTTRTDGMLLGLTYLRSQDVVGWHRHPLGGTNVIVESVATIPIDRQDQVWVSVKRTINGSTKRYIERLGDTFVNKTINEAVFVDSSLSFLGEAPSATLTPGATTGTAVTFTAGSSVFVAGDVGRHIRSGSAKAIITGYTSGTVVTARIVSDFSSTGLIASGSWTLSTSTISGLWHLEGQSVTLLSDGGTHPSRTVTNGKITLNGQYTYVHIGLGYSQVLKSLDLEGGSAIGSGQGSRTRITEIIVRMFESVGMRIGRDEDNLRSVDFRRPSDLMNEGVPLFSGDKVLRPKHGWKNGATVTIVNDQPLPMTVLGYVAKMEVSSAS